MNTADTLPSALQDSFILAVDDVPKNLQVVVSIQTEAGYEVMPATNGPQALERVRTKRPDLLLLDLMMPGMDGFEVCRRLKQQPDTAEIPVIFLTACNELEHLVQAFEVGAVDYVIKPFKAPELLARVRTHLELKHARDTLARQGARLRELNAGISQFLGIATHDLRNPLNNIMGSLSLISAVPDMTQADLREMLDIINQSAEHMLHLVENLLDVHAIEEGRMRLNPVELAIAEIVSAAVAGARAKAQAKQQTLEFARPTELCFVRADAHATRQVVDNLVSNAIKYSPPGMAIRVRLNATSHHVRLEVQDRGPGLNEEDRKKLFGRFARLSAKPTAGEKATGLGLSIVKRIVEASEARVWCESEPGHGATFIVEWPRV